MEILERNDIDGISYLNMNAPERLNALSDEMLAALQAEFDKLLTDTTIRVVVLSGSGKAFCAGHDLKQMTAARSNADGGVAAWKDLFDRCATMMQTIQRMPQPVIAQVHGIATAAGCQLVASCDMAVAAQGTRFGVNGVNIGLFCSTPMVALTRAIGRKKAFEMLTTGEFLTAEDAMAQGLINRVASPDGLEQTTRELAETVASKLSAAVRIGKEAFYQQIEMTTADAYGFTGDVMVANMARDDTSEGISAFLEKRKPTWSDN